jgi:hypothetical protein
MVVVAAAAERARGPLCGGAGGREGPAMQGLRPAVAPAHDPALRAGNKAGNKVAAGPGARQQVINFCAQRGIDNSAAGPRSQALPLAHQRALCQQLRRWRG